MVLQILMDANAKQHISGTQIVQHVVVIMVMAIFLLVVHVLTVKMLLTAKCLSTSLIQAVPVSQDLFGVPLQKLVIAILLVVFHFWLAQLV